MSTYHLLSDDAGTVLGVYSDACEESAREDGLAISKSTGFLVALHHVACDKAPRRGQSVSMRGITEWLGNRNVCR